MEGQKKTFLSKQKIIVINCLLCKVNFSQIGEIGIGSIFGEEEMINKETRKYFATCNRAPTIVYVLKKQVVLNSNQLDPHLSRFLRTLLKNIFPEWLKHAKST